MKKRFLSAFLVALLCLSLLPMSALADDYEFTVPRPPKISKLEICQENGAAWLELQLITPASVQNLIDMLVDFDRGHYISGLQMSLSIEGAAAYQLQMIDGGSEDKWNGLWRTEPISGLTSDSWVSVQIRYSGVDNDGVPVYSDWSDTLSLHDPSAQGPGQGGTQNEGQTTEFNADTWAIPELTQADAAGVIPEFLRTLDLKESITRAEFAAVSVKVYEALSGQKAEPAAVNPFTDTADPEVLKAYNVGITKGVSATEFAPNKLLSREEAATMLARVYKKVFFPDWTLETDGNYNELFRSLYMVENLFADDGDISSWARDSVYFMAFNDIIKGIEGGKFAPRAITDEQKAAGYALCKREEALLIAIRMVLNLQ